MKEKIVLDVIIVGGSFAGLSAALALGRSVRTALVLDNNDPCNKNSKHAHNFITWDGASPAEIAKKAKEQVLKYPTIVFAEGTAVDVKKDGKIFRIVTEKGEVYSSKKILLTTGIVDQIPELDGFSDCWGSSILHCPYCHGYEVKDQKTAVIANDEHGYHLCLVLTHWTKDILLLTNGKANLTKHHKNRLKSHGIEVNESEITGIVHEGGKLKTVSLSSGEKLEIPVMYARFPFKQKSVLAEKLGCKMTKSGHIRVDDCQKTSVHGVYAAGDNSSNSRTISIAVAAGTLAAMMINGELVTDTF
jgi:thioredoxin reductase